jgi:hypothetical protein
VRLTVVETFNAAWGLVERLLSMATKSPALAPACKLLDQVEATSSQLFNVFSVLTDLRTPSELSLRDLAADASRSIQQQLGLISISSLTVRLTLLTRVRALVQSHGEQLGTALSALEGHLQASLADSEGIAHGGAMQLGAALIRLVKLASTAASQPQTGHAPDPACPAMGLLLRAHQRSFSESLIFEEGHLVVKVGMLLKGASGPAANRDSSHFRR